MLHYQLSMDRGGNLIVMVPETVTGHDVDDIEELFRLIVRHLRRIVEKSKTKTPVAPAGHG